MASLSLKDICKVYPNGFEAVKDFNLEIEILYCFKSVRVYFTNIF